MIVADMSRGLQMLTAAIEDDMPLVQAVCRESQDAHGSLEPLLQALLVLNVTALKLANPGVSSTEQLQLIAMAVRHAWPDL